MKAAAPPLDIESWRAHLARHRPRTRPLSADLRRSAVAALLRQAAPDEETDILLIRRAERAGDPWSGHMGLPGGRMDAGDADILATAVRETREEVGVDLLTQAALLGRLDDLPAVARGRPTDLVITPFVFALPLGVDPALLANEEVAEAVWAPLAPMVRGESKATTSYVYEGKNVDLPAYDVGGRIVWGLTYRILEMLFDVVAGEPTATP